MMTPKKTTPKKTTPKKKSVKQSGMGSRCRSTQHELRDVVSFGDDVVTFACGHTADAQDMLQQLATSLYKQTPPAVRGLLLVMAFHNDTTDAVVWGDVQGDDLSMALEAGMEAAILAQRVRENPEVGMGELLTTMPPDAAMTMIRNAGFPLTPEQLAQVESGDYNIVLSPEQSALVNRMNTAAAEQFPLAAVRLQSQSDASVCYCVSCMRRRDETAKAIVNALAELESPSAAVETVQDILRQYDERVIARPSATRADLH